MSVLVAKAQPDCTCAGGSPDQNLILLDGVPVYNVNHLFGFLSVFNSDAINNVELIKGGIPARYGGQLSSVLDISMKEGNLKESGGVFTISPIAARFTYESPIKKDTSSFIISARRTWLDVASAVFSRQRFEPDVVQVVNSSTDTTFNNQTFIDATNIEAYLEDEISITRQISTNVGVRASGFWVNDEAYTNVQPRLAARYMVHPSLSLKVSYTYMAQYLHLLTNSSLGLPTDLWVSTTENIAPQRSEQVAAGIAKSLNRNRYDVSLEGYYKRMNNLITYRDGASYLFQNGETWENKVVAGDGESYGTELFINKKQGKVTGWLGYTLSWTYRWFDAIDNGRAFPFRYDRRHDISLLVNYHLPKDRTLSAIFVYNTGNAISIPTARYQGIAPPGWEYEDYYQNAFDDRLLLNQRNNFRMPAYHRLDISYQRAKEKNEIGSAPGYSPSTMPTTA